MNVGDIGNNILTQDSENRRTVKTTESLTGKSLQKASVRSGNTNASNIFAGEINLLKDPVTLKREEARKQAMGVVMDAFSNDKKIDDDIQSRRDRIHEMEQELKSATDKLNQINEDKEKLRETYNIDKDSQEYQDLKLLEKREAYKSGNAEITFSEEEQERLARIDEEGMTEYQQRSLELDKPAKVYRDQAKEAKKVIIEENAIIRGIQLERLKTHPMIDAQKQKDAILDAANSEIYGMLIDEVKDHLDEKMEEEKEKADEKEQEHKEKEEQIEKIKEKIEELERLANPEETEKTEKTSDNTPDTDSQMRDILEMDTIKNDVKKEVENIVDKMKLVAEDIKGIKVDELL